MAFVFLPCSSISFENKDLKKDKFKVFMNKMKGVLVKVKVIGLQAQTLRKSKKWLTMERLLLLINFFCWISY